MLRRVVVLIAVSSALFMTGTSGAWAGTNGPLVTTDGSSAKFIANGDKFQICDTDSDGDQAYVKFHYAGSGGTLRLNNTSGAGTCQTKSKYNIPEGRTVYYQSCQDDFPPDTCSKEVYGRA